MNDDEKYIKGYNHGYKLNRDMPQIMSKINFSGKQNTPYEEGFKDGKVRFEKEQEMGRPFSLADAKDKYLGEKKMPDRDMDKDR